MRQILQPFSLMAQLNNLGLFIFAYVVKDEYSGSQCQDPPHERFLNWIINGAVIVYTATLVLSLLHWLNILDYILRVLQCGAVCVTLQALSIFFLASGFHLVSMLYGLILYYTTPYSSCLSLNIFGRVTGLIYSIWAVSGFVILFRLLTRRNYTDSYIEV